MIFAWNGGGTVVNGDNSSHSDVESTSLPQNRNMKIVDHGIGMDRHMSSYARFRCPYIIPCFLCGKLMVKLKSTQIDKSTCPSIFFCINFPLYRLTFRCETTKKSWHDLNLTSSIGSSYGPNELVFNVIHLFSKSMQYHPLTAGNRVRIQQSVIIKWTNVFFVCFLLFILSIIDTEQWEHMRSLTSISQ